MKQFCYAYLSADAAGLEMRPAFMEDIKEAMRAEKGGFFSLSDAEERRLLKAQIECSERLEQMAGDMLATFYGSE